MTSNTWQRKSRLAKEVFQAFTRKGITKMAKENQVHLPEILMRNLGLQNKFSQPTKPIKAARKLMPMNVRIKLWEFWHMSDVSTNTSRRVKLKVGDKPKIQESLEFISSVSVMENKHHTQFFQSKWQTLNKTYKQLYVDFICENPDHVVGFGTFLALKPFYTRPVQKCNIEMSCCKKHLHTRWSINSLLEYAKKLKSELPFENYTGFFEHIYSDCSTFITTYFLGLCKG